MKKIVLDLENLSEEDIKFKEEIDEIIASEVAPKTQDLDDGKINVWDVLEPLGKKGLLGLRYPKELGGRGGSYLQEMLLSEALCYESLVYDMVRGASVYPAALIGLFGKGKTLGKHIKPLVTGEKKGCFCFTEPDAGSDLSRMKAIYEEDKDGDFILNGEKRFITNGSVADIMVVYGRNGAFIVTSDLDGFEMLEEYKLMGLHGLNLGHLKFTDVKVPKENILFYREVKSKTEESQKKRTSAISSMQQFLGPERVSMSLQALAVAKRAIEIAVRYSQERVQFKQPISEFEGISFKIAEMVANYEAGKSLYLRAYRNSQNPAIAAICKLFIVTSTHKICDEALQIMGGIGYTNKYPVERLLRDIRLHRIGGGTDEIMKYIIQKDIYKGFNREIREDMKEKTEFWF
ncbi:MAG: acyl-CoA dehydrogenase family protein [Promethearchaeota archaeon]|jgi:alkylation response protein AidB-like acyl-CoA dehydrogenase